MPRLKPKDPRISRPICPYCGQPSERVTGEAVYVGRTDLHSLWFYLCSPCDAYVGCHPGGDQPLGDLANHELRQARRFAHDALDVYWRERGASRTECYRRLAALMGLTRQRTHIAMFTLEQCGRATELASNSLIWAMSPDEFDRALGDTLMRP